VRNDVAMTGEITLRGLVAAGRRHQGEVPRRPPRRHQARHLPERNRKDVIEIPEQPKKEIEIQFVKRMDELLPLVLTEMPKLGVMSAPVLPPPPAPPPPQRRRPPVAIDQRRPVRRREAAAGRSRGWRR
jgi:ATP-dependent Lon protease